MVTERLDLETEQRVELVQQHRVRYEFASQFVHNKTVLDIACGTGFGSAMMAKSGARFVHAVDISDEALAIASSRHTLREVLFEQANAEKYMNGRKYDMIVSFETIEHLHDYRRFLYNVQQMLNDQSTFIVSTPVRLHGKITDKPENPFHVQEWTVEEFQNLLKEFFSTVEVYYQYNFQKYWFPLSRTLQKILCRFLEPKTLNIIESFGVSKHPPASRFFCFSPAYLVVCSQL